MKKSAITFLIFFLAVCFSAYSQSAYKSGEYFKFQVSYGIVNAGVATLELKESTYDGKKVYHAKGIGKTTAEKLLIHFKSVKNIKEASEKELLSIVNTKQAKAILEFYMKEKPQLN